MQREATLFHIFSGPINARILQRARREIIDNCNDPFFSTKPVEQSNFALSLDRRRIGAGRRSSLLGLAGTRFLFFFSRSFTRTCELLIPRHSLARALVGFATARSEEKGIVAI